MTLSFGEQTEETYERWAQAAGNRKALRYLLRIETSNLKLFNYLHSGKGGAQKTWPARLEALATLRKLGYQVGGRNDRHSRPEFGRFSSRYPHL